MLLAPLASGFASVTQILSRGRTFLLRLPGMQFSAASTKLVKNVLWRSRTDIFGGLARLRGSGATSRVRAGAPQKLLDLWRAPGISLFCSSLCTSYWRDVHCFPCFRCGCRLLWCWNHWFRDAFCKRFFCSSVRCTGTRQTRRERLTGALTLLMFLPFRLSLPSVLENSSRRLLQNPRSAYIVDDRQN